MQKVVLIAIIAAAISAGCKKQEFMKKHEAQFKLNGVSYTCGEDQVWAEYYSGVTLLTVNAFAGSASTNGASIVVDLTKINQTVAIDSGQEGWYARGTNSAVQYFPINGEWKITSHEEGKAESRHTEGTFSFTGVNQYNAADTLRITEGHFYVNNY
ncbi:MAG: hypothetical protein U0V74_15410 [Chitinophagales bacterium]